MNETNSTSGQVMNPPSQDEAGNLDTPLHGQRTQTPRADELTGASSESEARPVTPTAQCIDGMPHRWFDSRCYDLAEYFYPGAPKELLDELAQRIQDQCEENDALDAWQEAHTQRRLTQ